MAEKNKGRKMQYLMFGLCSLIALAACFAVLVVTVRSVDANNSSVVQYDTESKTEITGETAQLAAYLKNLTEKTQNNRFVKVNSYRDVNVDDSTVTVCDLQGNELQKDKNLLIYAKNNMIPAVDGYYGEDYTGVFGTVYQDMPLVDLGEQNINDSRFSVGQADEQGNPVYDSNSGELIDGDYYFIKLGVDPAAAQAHKLFALDEKEAICKSFSDGVAQVCTVENAELAVKDLIINAKVNRLVDELEYITFEKVYTVKADATFINELEVFGTRHIEFEYKVIQKFEYHYAGIRFSEHSVTVEPGGEVALSVNAVIENDSEYTVTFASSDTSVATVDEMGYVKGITQSDKPVTVTVTLRYLDEVFEDTCTVSVTQAENMITG